MTSLFEDKIEDPFEVGTPADLAESKKLLAELQMLNCDIRAGEATRSMLSLQQAVYDRRETEGMGL